MRTRNTEAPYRWRRFAFTDARRFGRLICVCCGLPARDIVSSHRTSACGSACHVDHVPGIYVRVVDARRGQGACACCYHMWHDRGPRTIRRPYADHVLDACSRHRSRDGTTCALCLDDFFPGFAHTYVASCGHFFCSDATCRAMLAVGAPCPLCRRPIQHIVDAG